MAVVLALVSAVAYGLSDFVGGLVVPPRLGVGRRGPGRYLSSTVCVAVIALFVAGGPTPRRLRLGGACGPGDRGRTAFLYRGFASGRMSAVAPVSAVGAALVPVAVGALGGERVSAVVWLGILAALPGIWLVASVPDDDLTHVHGETPPTRTGLADGLIDGVLAGLGFGVLFAALAQIPDGAGLWPLTVAQAVSVPVVVALAVVARAEWAAAGRTVRWALAGRADRSGGHRVVPAVDPARPPHRLRGARVAVPRHHGPAGSPGAA